VQNRPARRCNLTRSLRDFALALGRSRHDPTMSQYRRPRIDGGMFFFTVGLADRYVKNGLLPAD
jgi:hypothetical protein